MALDSLGGRPLPSRAGFRDVAMVRYLDERFVELGEPAYFFGCRRPPARPQSSCQASISGSSSPRRAMTASGSASAQAGTALLGTSTARIPARFAPYTSS